MKKTILVLGATGTLGRPVSYALRESGFQVRIMSRDLQKARKVLDDTFEMIVGNPLDIGCLERSLADCFGVHISLPWEIEQQVVEAVAKLAPRLGVRRITYISGATVAEENRWFPMVNGKYLSEKAIQESGVPYSIFCPTWVMESLPMFVNQGRAIVLGKQPCPYHWVAAEDIGRMVSLAYRKDEAANKRFIVHGPEKISMREALMRYCTAFHPDIRQVSSLPFGLVSLLASLTGNQDLRFAGKMMAYFEKVGEGSRTPGTDDVVGVPTTTLADWLKTGRVNAV